LGNATVVTYDAGGNQLSVRDPNNVGANMLYDPLGRNTQRTDTVNDVTRTEYDRAGNATRQIDAKNRPTLISYDARGRRRLTTDRISAATTFTYTPLGQLASLSDAENQTTSYTYDARGLKLTERYPDHTGGSTVGQTGYGIVTFVYDNAGRILRKQDQLGVTLTHSYDLAGRMNRRDYRTAANSPSGTIADSDTFTFDRASRMRTAVNGRYTNTVTYTYDPVGRKATEALTISARTYTTGQAYNARNELTTITYPNNTTSTRSYHATGTLNQLRLDGSTVSTRSYDAGRRQTTDVLSNGITETRTYRNDNLLSAINYSNTSLGNMTYTWDANKNKTSESVTGVMSGYGFTSAGTTYDFEDRLTGFSRAATSGPASLSQSWNLTAVGDWTSVTTNGTAQSRTHGPTHELLTAGGQNVATDVKGNITTLPANLRPAGATTAMNLTWDSDNKLRSADIDANGTADVNFQYDALGRRVARTGTGGSVVFVQMDQQTIADYPVGGAATTPTFRYVYASYIDEPVVRKGPTSTSTLHFYHRNHQYSVTAITTSTGGIAERYAYTAYGQPTILNASGTVISATTLSNRYSYTGREWDATLGLHHFRARWMSPGAGRFLGRDPIGYEGSPNSLYAYVRARSLISMDPKGLYQIADCVPDYYVEPPDQPWQGQCNIKVRCHGVPYLPGIGGVTSLPAIDLCGNYLQHCGLILDDGAGRVVSLDGSGGCENNFNWQEPPFLPNGRTGPSYSFPTQVCECLRQKAKTWNSIKIPRTNTGCNSNTSLRCLAGACGIPFSIGSGMPYGGCTPLGYNGCKEYNCVRWSEPMVCFGKSKRVCYEHEDFCTFYWRHANNGTVPPTPNA